MNMLKMRVCVLQLHTLSQSDVQGSAGEILSPSTAMATACKSPLTVQEQGGELPPDEFWRWIRVVNLKPLHVPPAGTPGRFTSYTSYTSLSLE